MSSQADVVAVVVAVFSALLSALSLVISYRTYRRGGARIKVIMEHRQYGNYSAHDMEAVLRVINKGLGSIQVTNWRIEARKNWEWNSSYPYVKFPDRWHDLLINPADYGPSVPYTLNGNHEVSWTTKDGDLEPAFRRISEYDYQIRSRTKVTLGTGKTIRCRVGVICEFDERPRPTAD